MKYYLLKVFITSLVVVAISETSKKSFWLASLLASLPLTSLLAFIWTYAEAKNIEPVIKLSYGIFWMVIPSLSFFLLLPLMLKRVWDLLFLLQGRWWGRPFFMLGMDGFCENLELRFKITC